MTPDEFAEFWDVVTPAKDTMGLTYLEYLNGMAQAELHPTYGAKLEFLTPNQLMTVSLDVPVDRKEAKLMMASLSRAERFGVTVDSGKSAAVRKAAAQIIEWLKNAESDDEDED